MTSVLVDARELTGESSASGVGTTIRGLLTGLAANGTDVRALAEARLDLPTGVTRVPIQRFVQGGRRRAVLEHELRLPLELHRDDAAVFHNPLFHPPWRVDRPWVQTLYDVIPLVRPDAHTEVLRRRWRRFTPRYRKADAVVAISRHAADEGTRVLGLDPRKVEVVPLAAWPGYRPAGPDDAVPDDLPYLLVVGEYSHRKGFGDAFQVAAAVAEAGLPHRLVVAGRVPAHVADELDALVRASPRPDRIDVRGFVPDLAALYRHAALVLVPTRYEGFGLPALEGMASGVPVVSYDNSSLPEVVGDGGLLVPDGDISALAEATIRVLREPALAEDLRGRGLVRAATFSWARAAAGYAAIYDQVAR